jgi:hypothetical protein
MTSVIVKVEIGEDSRCGNCRFYDWYKHCNLFDKDLEREKIMCGNGLGYYKPIRCKECMQAEVKDDETVC